MRLQTLAISLLLALLMAGCGTPAAGSAESTTTAPVAADATTTTVATETTSTTVAASSTTAAPAPDDGIYELLTTEVIYHEDDEGTWAMDVFYPDAEGPWPLVVVYHGMTTFPALMEARLIAAQGAVAVAPQWLKVTSQFPEKYIDGTWLDRASCAVNMAQHHSEEFGADPDRTTAVGFSAGTLPAHWAGLGLMRDELCDEPLLAQPVGAVMGDNQFIFFDRVWDSVIEGPSGAMAEDTLDRFVNPQRWDVPSDLAVYLWTSDFRYGRDIDNPPGDESWIHLRDTTGTLIDDLAAVGAFDDEDIDWMDNALLMEMRMLAAGIDVEHEAVGGGHSYSETVFDAIQELIGE